MTLSERRESIIEMFLETNFVTIIDIVNRFGISNETARRDLDYLQDQKLIQRVYGGAILKQHYGPASAAPKASKNLYAIGKAAADLVKPGESIFLGNGSTTLQVAKQLRSRRNITVITGSLANINVLADSDINLIVLGGHLSHNELDICGTLASDCISKFYCNKAIFGCGGITADLDIMDYNSNNLPLHSQFVRHSAQHILVTASHKFDTPAFSMGCSIRDIDIIITDTRLSPEYAHRIRSLNIDLIMVDLNDAEFEM